MRRSPRSCARAARRCPRAPCPILPPSLSPRAPPLLACPQVTPELCARYEALLAGIGFRNTMGLDAAAIQEMLAIHDSE